MNSAVLYFQARHFAHPFACDNAGSKKHAMVEQVQFARIGYYAVALQAEFLPVAR